MAESRESPDQRIDVDYCRISLDKNGFGDGVDSQHLDNVQIAEEDGRTITRTYTDNDVSAYSGAERPEYLQLCRDIAADLITSVTFWHANRLHRDIEEASRFLRLAIAHDVRLFSYSKGGEYNLKRNQGRQDFLSDTLAAQGESGQRGDRVTLARRRQARHGTFGGGVRPYGHGVETGYVRRVCVNPKAPPAERVYEDRPVLDMSKARPDEKAEIRRWAADLLAGVSRNQVLAGLRQRGVLTVSQKDGRVLRRGGRTVEPLGWSGRTIVQILTSPRVSGHSTYKGEIIKRNAYEQILSDDTREALITLFADPARKTSPGPAPKWLGSLIHRCGHCDDGTTETVRYNEKGAPVYRCRIKGHCSHDVRTVDEYVRLVAIERLSRDDLSDLIATPPTVDIAALRAETAVLIQRKQDAAMQYAQGAIDASMMATITAAIDKKLNATNAVLISNAAVSPLTEFIGVSDAAHVWDALTLGRRREILRLIFTITLVPVGRGRRPPVEDRVRFGPPQ